MGPEATNYREVVMDKMDTEEVHGQDRIDLLEELIALLDVERELLERKLNDDN
jgi:hypothetical protein